MAGKPMVTTGRREDSPGKRKAEKTGQVVITEMRVSPKVGDPAPMVGEPQDKPPVAKVAEKEEEEEKEKKDAPEAAALEKNEQAKPIYSAVDLFSVMPDL